MLSAIIFDWRLAAVNVSLNALAVVVPSAALAPCASLMSFGTSSAGILNSFARLNASIKSASDTSPPVKSLSFFKSSALDPSPLNAASIV